jgi:hypothetical protein
MYFGLVCNGTSSLAMVWNQFFMRKDAAMDYVRKRRSLPTKLFRLLVKLEKTKMTEGKDINVIEDNILHDNCKLPRFQYANCANDIAERRVEIHRIIREFLQSREEKRSCWSVEK